LVEESIRLAPKEFSLGARRPGWDLPMNNGDCSLMADGEGISIIDRKTGQHRPSTFKDWLDATRLNDALDEIGVYWDMTETEGEGDSLAGSVKHWGNIFRNFSKHVQDASSSEEHSIWLLEVMQAVFGDKETIKRTNPLSFLICPQSPLIIEKQHTDAYLALIEWGIPAAIMPMPLMGGTGPGNMISMVILGNCEVLSMLCLIQAANPGTPFISAPALAVMNPRSGNYSAGAIESGLLSAAAIEMSKYYQIPVEGTGGSTDMFSPGIQSTYERTMNMMIPMMSWPDLMVGAGLLGGSMIVSLEQLLIDVEVFRMNKQVHRGIPTTDEKWLDDVIEKAGPGGNFLGAKSTATNIRAGEWLLPELGFHGTQQAWEQGGRKDILQEAKEKVDEILSTYKPLPLGSDVEKELEKIYKHAQESER
jgi:trimethylamine--corrinoid protein Co-methyltransferase